MKKMMILVYTLVLSFTTDAQELIKDIDNNEYHTVLIGKNLWMVENLKVTHYNNDDTIETTKKSEEKIKNGSQKYRWSINVNNNQVPNQLYTWYAITDQRGVCPSGWEIPSDSDWKEAIDIIFNESNSSHATNQVNFPNLTYKENILENKHPFISTLEYSGSRISNGRFIFKDIYAYFWTSTADYKGFSWMWYFSQNSIMHYNFEQNGGLSVKCIKAN